MASSSTDVAANSSRDKLQASCNELHQLLDDLSQCINTNQHETSASFTIPQIEILHAALPSQIYTQPANGDASEQTEYNAYRCKCSFQILPISYFTSPSGNEDATTTDDELVYAVRENGKVCQLDNGIFPPANRRIRSAMHSLLKSLNSRKDGDETSLKFERLRSNLTSVTFVSSWGDGGTMGGGDCLVTLHFGPPGILSSQINSNTNSATTLDEQRRHMQQTWEEEAQQLCDECKLTSITGRSKGVKLNVLSKSARKHNTFDDNAISDEGIIHDDLWLTLIKTDASSNTVVETVTLVPPPTISSVRCVYNKPATAFQHPNAGVMLTSLHWILRVLSQIAQEQEQNATTQKPRLLEMYCGCGAHTIPLAKSALLSEVVAVELDERLVNACRRNCRLNGCLKDSDAFENYSTTVQVFKGDAAEWAKKTLKDQSKQRTNTKQPSFNHYKNFDILLVDPPREGLDKIVCDLAINKGTFQHVVYISCGRVALLRDLDILCKGGFNVVDLAVIDLFPGTDAVESLVHLRRRG